MSIKIAIIDDTPFIREIIRNIVEKNQIEVVFEASTGDEAVELMLKHNPDVIIMDLVMPKMNGIEATKLILQEKPNMKIIVCSTVTNEELVNRAMQAGAKSYIYKPFNKDKLLSVIENATKELQPHG